MTKEERKLWYDFLKNLPQNFYRQKVFNNYIVDFYCPKSKLIIELDGSGHFNETNIINDRKRDAFFNELGLRVLRIPNDEITSNFKGVCEEILKILNETTVKIWQGKRK